MKSIVCPRRMVAAACCALLVNASGLSYGADPGFLDLQRMRLQREQRQDELRLNLDQARRADQLRLEAAQRRTLLQPEFGQLKIPTQDDAQRRLQLEQSLLQERLSQQILNQTLSLRDRRLRQTLMPEPDAIPGALLQAERHRFMREREAQFLQFQY